jgi:Outer membrane protein beta-barrel domain
MKVIALVALIGLITAFPASAQDQRGWVDVNIGMAAAAEKSYSVSVEQILFRETARFEADYDWTPGADFDFGGGYMITPLVGVGVSFSGTAHLNTASVFARIPHPTRFNAHAQDTAETSDELKKTEGAVHLQAVLQPVSTPNARVRLFGGPTYFRVTQDTFDTIRYAQVFQVFGPLNEIDITDAPFSETEGTAWGFHVGSDVAWFFSRVVGVGAFARFSRGTVEITDLGGSIIETKAGGLQSGGGLRLRF